MRIVYDDLNEFAEVLIRCADTVKKGKCSYCPFYDRCTIDDKENRHIMCGEIDNSQKYLSLIRNQQIIPLSEVHNELH